MLGYGCRLVERKLSFAMKDIEEKYKGEHMVAEQVNVEYHQFYSEIAMYSTKGNDVKLVKFEAIQN